MEVDADHGVGSDPLHNNVILSGRGKGSSAVRHGADISPHKNLSAEGKGLVTFSSNEQGKCPVTFSSNEQGKMPECRECDGICKPCWRIQTEFAALVGTLAPREDFIPVPGGTAKDFGNGESTHAMERCFGDWAFTVPNMCVRSSKV